MKTYQETEKVCRGCSRERELFNDSPFCRECYTKIKYSPWEKSMKQVIYYVEHKKEIKQKRKEYQQAHKEQVAAANKKYVQSHREQWNAYQREYKKRKAAENKALRERVAQLEAQLDKLNTAK